MLHTTVHML